MTLFSDPGAGFLCRRGGANWVLSSELSPTETDKMSRDCRTGASRGPASREDAGGLSEHLPSWRAWTGRASLTPGPCSILPFFTALTSVSNSALLGRTNWLRFASPFWAPLLFPTVPRSHRQCLACGKWSASVDWVSQLHFKLSTLRLSKRFWIHKVSSVFTKRYPQASEVAQRTCLPKEKM